MDVKQDTATGVASSENAPDAVSSNGLPVNKATSPGIAYFGRTDMLLRIRSFEHLG